MVMIFQPSTQVLLRASGFVPLGLVAVTEFAVVDYLLVEWDFEDQLSPFFNS